MKKLLLSLFLIALLISCKKDTVDLGQKETDTTPTPKDFQFKNTKWKLTKATSYLVYPGNLNYTLDVYAVTPECKNDNIIYFSANGIVTIDEGATKCSPSDPQAVPGSETWKLSTDKKVLTVSNSISNPYGIKEIVSEVLTLNEQNLVLKYFVTNDGATSTTTYTYQRVL